MHEKTYRVNIYGRVQGVGFRPYIYNLATMQALKGYVTNDENGVLIILQCNQKQIEKFSVDLKKQKPRGAIISSIEIAEIVYKEKFQKFEIKITEPNAKIDTSLTPDFAICKACQAELFDPKNRRYFYPFTTCIQCGPRYSITQKFPFERENTSIAAYKMCGICEAEYTNPTDLRFHSQTNTCPACGVKIHFTDNHGKAFHGSNQEIFYELSKNLAHGKIIAVKNTSGYLLLCDSTNKEAVEQLRQRKKRPAKPLAILFSSVENAKLYLQINDAKAEELASTSSPIVILKQKNKLDLSIEQIAPNRSTIGAMLPNSGILAIISSLFKKPLVATSGNFHGSPICVTEKAAVETLKPIADYFLHHDLEILHPQDDSVVKFSEKYCEKIILRRARGFAPNFECTSLKTLNHSQKKILCMGSDLKNTIAAIPNNHCYLSEYIGDLANYETFNRFENTINSYQQIFDFQPDTILADLHPHFESAKKANDFESNKKLEFVKIQHHKAHFAAILSEHDLWNSPNNPLGFIWDGTGFGAENEIWGGETFELSNKNISRIGHLDYFPWILGDKMAKNPKISAFSICENKQDLAKYFDNNEWKLYTKLINECAIKTSSMGRFFDAIAFILGFQSAISFESEAAMFLEDLAQKAYSQNKMPFDYLQNETITTNIPTQKIFSQVFSDTKTNVEIESIALNFHFTLIKCIKKIANHHKCRNIAFSGGVFQNTVLVDLILEHLGPKFKLFFHKNLSPNDENIAFGQLSYYLNLTNKNN